MKNSVLLFPFILLLACNALAYYHTHSPVLCMANMAMAIFIVWQRIRRRTPAFLSPIPGAARPETARAVQFPQPTVLKPVAPEESVMKTARNGLSPEKRMDIVRSILEQMEKAKLYQETELTLQQLAGVLGVPAYQVSIALNEGLNKTFYDLVNGYRVEEAKRLLKDERNMNYTILSVGFDAGFNSKTTFNTVFKKFTGLTPSDYRNRYGCRLEAA